MNKILKLFLYLTCFSIIVWCLAYVNLSSLQPDTYRLNIIAQRLLLQSEGNHHGICHIRKNETNMSIIHGNVTELRKLRDLVQRRLFYIQNPKNCTAAKKIICKPSYAGFGSTLHQLTFCLIAAYATERTLIIRSKRWIYAKEGWETVFLPVSTNCTSVMNNTVTRTKTLKNIHDKQAIALPGMRSVDLVDFMPFAIPADLADRLESVHINPEVWWIGQFVDYLIRPNDDLKLHLRKQQKQLAFRRPLIGLHIRRTDKIRDSNYFNLSEYMDVVEKWFEEHLQNNTQTRYIFIATDSPSVIEEALRTYQNYTFVYHKMAITDRYSLSSLKGIISDLNTLRMCDFVACTMSSNICRVVNELKGSRDGCSAYRLVSLDMDYFFNAIVMRKTNEIPLQTMTARYHGLKPIKDKTDNPKRILFSTDRNKSRVVMPIYPELKERSGA